MSTGKHAVPDGATPIRVLIVDDSAVVRGALGRIIDAEPDMRVVTTAVHGRDLLDALKHTAVDVVLLDVEMPVMDGLTALLEITRRFPEVRVIMSSSLTQEGAAITMRALASGAVDFIHKPSAKDGVTGLQSLAMQLVAKVRAVATSRTAGRAGLHTALHSASHPTLHSVAPAAAMSPAAAHVTPLIEPRVVAIAASTGGPNALADIVRALPGDFPLPILVTQHMPPIFTNLLAQRLDRSGALTCAEARDGEPIAAGRIYLAPGDAHMTVARTGAVPSIRLGYGEPENHCRPSADPMLRSAAQVYGGGVVAVVLTGMGEDGRRGCAAVAQAGGRIFVQDEASSVVWGMPGSVVESQLPCTIVPLASMATQLADVCSTLREPRASRDSAHRTRT